MTVKVKFCGAAGTVTGSCYWIQTDTSWFLVDCGLFQGTKTVKQLNYNDFPFDPKDIDFVILTHAHTDHSALIPKLVKKGFSGPVYATTATRDLLRYMLPDSGYIQEVEVARLNRRNQQRGKPVVQPIYTSKDAKISLSQIRSVDYEEWLEPAPGVRVRFWNAGHILGSASIEIELTEKKEKQRLLFSGDIGPDHKLFHAEPDAPDGFDYVFCESTYGGRFREDADLDKRRQILASEINDAMDAGGALVIPSFAVERTQELLLDIAYLLQEDKIPCAAVFLDSPLAIKITSVFAKYEEQLEDISDGMSPFAHPKFHFTESVDDSKAIARFTGGVIILAASGMCDAGRIRHHLKNHLWRPQSTILQVGYQAEGTLGRLLEEGRKRVNIQGEAIQVRARLRKIDTYSGHADRNGLIDWVKARGPVSQKIFLTHGSAESLVALQESLISEGYDADQIVIPALDDAFELSRTRTTKKTHGLTRRLEPETMSKLDWHNDLAQLTLDIRSMLETAPDDQRDKILSKLRKTLEANRRSRH